MRFSFRRVVPMRVRAWNAKVVLTALALQVLALALLGPRDAGAACNPNDTKVTVCVAQVPADPPACGPNTALHEYWEGLGSYNPVIPFGCSEVQLVVTFGSGEGNWTFDAGPNGLCLLSTKVGGVSCSFVDDCLVCGHGPVNLTEYSARSAFFGDVTRFPNRVVDAPQESIVHIADVSEGFPINVGTVDGQYNQVVGVFNGPQGGIGSLSAQLYVNDVSIDRKPATTTSGNPTRVDFVVWDPDPTLQPERCPPGVCCSVGKPVSVLTGNVFFDQADGDIAGISGFLGFTRSYNSRRAYANLGGIFGRGWSHTFEKTVSEYSPTTLLLRQADGEPLYFSNKDSGDANTFLASIPATEQSSIVRQPGAGYVRQFRAGGSESYDVAGRLVQLTDPTGNTTVIARDGSGLMTAVTDPGGRAFTFGYESTRISTLSGPQGAVASYRYYPNSGQLQSVEYPDGSGYTFVYDNSGQLLRMVDASGTIVEEHTYDNANGRGLTSEIANGQEKYTLDYQPNQTTVTDALGAVTTYHWKSVDGIRHIDRRTGPCPSCGGSGEVESWEYNDRGQVELHTDAAGTVTKNTYDPATSDLLTVTEAFGTPDARTTTYTYYPDGRVHTRTGPDGSQKTYTYGPSGPLTVTEKVTTSQSRTTTMTYRPNGKLETIEDPLHKVTTFAYTGADLTKVTDPLGHFTTFGYDSMGRRTATTDALQHATTTGYDGRGHVTTVIQNNGHHTDFTYDGGGRRTSVTDPLGRKTVLVYDHYGRLQSVVDPLGGITTYGYDLMSRLTSLRDAKGRTTSWEYFLDGRGKKVTYPLGAFETSTYDSAGRLKTKTDRRNIVTTLDYDIFSRAKIKTYSDGTPQVSYTYDPGADRLKTAANGTDSLTWGYDLAGQLRSELSTKNGSTVSYTPFDDGLRASVLLNGVQQVSYTYDDAKRLQTLVASTSGGNKIFTFGYYDDNVPNYVLQPNGLLVGYVVDDAHQLGTQVLKQGTNIIDYSQYGYDAAGNRTYKARPDVSEGYRYDVLSRLTQVDRSTKRWRYQYDAVGNRTSEQVDNIVMTSTYDDRNRLGGSSAGGMMRWAGSLNEPGFVALTSVTVNGQVARMLPGNLFEADIPVTPGTNTVTVIALDRNGNTSSKNYLVTVSGAGTSYTYDGSGNLNQRVEGANTWTYEWTAENELKRVLKNNVEQARFAYDPIGRRVEKVAGGVTSLYAYDGANILRQIAGTTTYKYLNNLGVDQPLAVDNGATTTYFQTDGLGSVVRLTNSSGTVTPYRAYDAWGNNELGGALAGLAFTAREWDPEIGLYYYRARYYDPTVGRFISEDPVRTAKRDLDQLNGYAYVAGRPTGMVDPYGDTMSEGLWCFLNWKACQRAGECRDQALLAERMLFHSNTGNTPGDAFRHCFLSCCLGQRLGPRKAQQVTDAHEAFPGNPLCENKMDQLNNATGRALAASSAGGNCYTMCSNAPLQKCVVGSCDETGGSYPIYTP